MRKLVLGIAAALLAGIAAAHAQASRPGRSRWWCRSRRAARPMWPRASWPRRCGRFSASRCVIENVGGAGGSIAVGRVARAAPDGYTIDIGQWDTHVGAIIYNLNYDLQTDFEPIGLISINPQLLVGRKNLEANRLNELVAWMKAHPGDAKFVNQNAAANISGLLLQQLTNTKLTFIPIAAQARR